MGWKECGYLSLTKDGKKVSIVIKKVRYIANLKETKDVLDDSLSYTLVFEPVEIIGERKGLSDDNVE